MPKPRHYFQFYYRPRQNLEIYYRLFPIYYRPEIFGILLRHVFSATFAPSKSSNARLGFGGLFLVKKLKS